MTQKTFFAIILTVVFSLASFTLLAGNHASNTEAGTNSKEKTTASTDHDMAKKSSALPDSSSKVPHGKAHAPQMEELPHIHKFHKERVKKIKKHHSKYWFLSQALLALCHLSILVIGYLHATH